MERIGKIRMEVADLEALIGPPRKRPPAVDWRTLESGMGLTFPADHRELCARYSSLHFDGLLTWVNSGLWEPRATIQGAKDELEFLRQRKLNFSEMTLLDDQGQWSKRPAFPVYPEPGGLLMWGNTYNADHCMWLTDPDPEKWTIVIENGNFWHFHGGLLDFLVGILEGSVRCPLLPEGWPSSFAVEEIEG
ncbi:hypothetical protein [Actinomadura bangladeshensis]|uniref:hypothetical protein n=1 Tax=Actinomadura bangladeshensis TaxID=453573 RepID=UPI001FB578D8|nr:hypothetical protein [Actinomadura bangladeshensis]